MIRRDLFAVQERSTEETDDFAWCVMRITRSLKTAKRFAADIRARARDSQYIIEARLVHPSQHLVDAYCLFGNQILD